MSGPFTCNALNRRWLSLRKAAYAPLSRANNQPLRLKSSRDSLSYESHERFSRSTRFTTIPNFYEIPTDCSNVARFRGFSDSSNLRGYLYRWKGAVITARYGDRGQPARRREERRVVGRVVCVSI